MGKKIIIGVTILLIAGLIAGWYIFTREAKYLGTSAFKAIPDNAAVVVRIPCIQKYTTFTLKNPVWKSCSEIPGINDLYKKFSFLDSLLNTSQKQNNPITEKDLTMVYSNGENNIIWTSLIELSTITEKRAVSDLIEKFFGKPGVSREEIQFEEARITNYNRPEEITSDHFYTSFYHGLFIGSNDLNTIQKAILRLKNPLTIAPRVFDKSNKSNSANVDARIYINHKTFPSITKNLFSDSFFKKLMVAMPFADWSEIDLLQQNDGMILNGISYTSDSVKSQLNLFQHQKADSFRLASVLPSETSFFLGYVLSDNAKYFRDYEELLDHANLLQDYKRSLTDVDSTYGTNLQQIISDHLAGDVAIVFTRPDPVMKEENKYLIMRINNENLVSDALKPITKIIPPARKREKPKNYIEYRLDQETVFKIYESQVNDLGKRIFGEPFTDVATNFYSFFDNCLIMSSSVGSLGRFLRANLYHETLSNDKLYLKFVSGLSDKLNIYVWDSPGRSMPFFKNSIDSITCERLTKRHDALLKIESLGWQTGNENGLMYNTAQLKYNPEAHEDPASRIWKTHPGKSMITLSKFVRNPNDQSHPDLLIQDAGFNVSLLTFDGRILWKHKLKSAIKSEIFQLDYFKDGQVQYCLSTAEAIHLINREGEYLPKFPIKLAAGATNGVSIPDYDVTKDYRFFIACKDHKIYQFDKKGRAVSGWSGPKTGHSVITPVQFFRDEKKDYIVYTDLHTIYGLDRKGKSVLPFKGEFALSENRLVFIPKSGKNKARLVATDSKGSVLLIGFDGVVKKLTSSKLQGDHYFACFKQGDSGELRYLISNGDSLVQLDHEGKKRFSKKFNHNLSLPPQLFTFPDRSVKIGITDSEENKIYLLNSDGSLVNGFPLDGNISFDLVFPEDQGAPFNMVTESENGNLMMYEVK